MLLCQKLYLTITAMISEVEMIAQRLFGREICINRYIFVPTQCHNTEAVTYDDKHAKFHS
jgi:hypothetical protein